MKILNIINARKPFLIEQIRALERHGIECTTICVPGEYHAGESELQSRGLWEYMRFYPTVLKSSLDKYDLIHAHYGLTAPFALAQPRRPVVLSLWGRDLFGPASRVTKLCARQCDEIIVRSEEMRTELGMKAHIVERGVDLDKFYPIDKDKARAEVGWDKTSKHILFPYSPQREKKNYPLAERIVQEVNSRFEFDVQLHAVFNEPHDMIPVYMNAADLLLMTSRPKSEGSPNTVKEALASNLPVVSTPVGDVVQLLDGVNNSYVCNESDDLICKTSEILSIGERSNGRERAKQISWDRTVRQLVEVYEAALEC